MRRRCLTSMLLPLVEELFWLTGFFRKCDCRAACYSVAFAKGRISPRPLPGGVGSAGCMRGCCTASAVPCGVLTSGGAVVCRVDDLRVCTETAEEHERVLRRLLEMLRASRIELHQKKTQPAADSVEFLGHGGSGRVLLRTWRLFHAVVSLDRNGLMCFTRIRTPSAEPSAVDA
ncbi:hypothetical protein Agub_g13415 [Astrephomene gubernaculifera]|uniref:Reverse transcriptase domain-containing protein n=1 Tax=Astrephomene gubernaculifera TaxID=47775 RepID=A0AAD3DZY0_9CHLO|nr:hypothetical protein Agub_g13415 [Astrephomene gubernaculifera]